MQSTYISSYHHVTYHTSHIIIYHPRNMGMRLPWRWSDPIWYDLMVWWFDSLMVWWFDTIWYHVKVVVASQSHNRHSQPLPAPAKLCRSDFSSILRRNLEPLITEYILPIVLHSQGRWINWLKMRRTYRLRPPLRFIVVDHRAKPNADHDERLTLTIWLHPTRKKEEGRGDDGRGKSAIWANRSRPHWSKQDERGKESAIVRSEWRVRLRIKE